MRVGVLGTGSIGMRHLGALSQIKGVEPVALPFRAHRVDELRAEGWTAQSPEDADVDAIIIASDTGLHLTHSEQFASLPQLIEKPLASSAAQISGSHTEVLQRRVWVGCCLRFHPVLQAFRDAARSLRGPVQVLIVCHSDLSQWRPNRDYRELYSARAGEGGALRELIHEIDYACWIFGWPESVRGNVGHSRRLEIADEESATLTSRHGEVTVEFDLSIASDRTERWATASDSQQEVKMDFIAGSVSVKGVPVALPPCDRNTMYVAQARAFVQAAQGQVSSDLATAADGFRALEICDLVRGGVTLTPTASGVQP